MTTQHIATKKLSVEAAKSFIRSVEEVSSYYMFAAKHTPYSTIDTPMPEDTTNSTISVYNDMLFGKKIGPEDVISMTNRVDWQPNVVYDMYDDGVVLDDKQYFVMVQEGINYRVYKCLFNNNTESLVEPFGTDLDPIEMPEDGYVWKYLYSFDESTARKFMTNSHIPIVVNSAVKNAATDGSINIIKIEYGGVGYNNYNIGSFVESDDIIIDNNVLQYGLSGNASGTNDFYRGCIIKITSGDALNEYRIINDYYISTNGKKIILIDRPFIGNVQKSDTYEIYPNVYVYDEGGTSTQECFARAIINPLSGNTVSRVEILNPGIGYRKARAVIIPDETVGVANGFGANITPIISPQGGHGSNLTAELNGSYVGISVSFVKDVEPLISRGSEDYRTIGIIKDPLFANVKIMIDSSLTSGTFITNENIIRYKPIKLSGNVSVTTSNSYVYATPDIVNSLRLNDTVIISDGTKQIYSEVMNISTLSFNISDIPTFTSSNCSIVLTESEQFAKLSEANNTYLKLTDVKPIGEDKSTYMIGETSSAMAVVDLASTPYLYIGNRDGEGFAQYNQLTKFVGEFSSGINFELDEYIVQDTAGTSSNRPTARLYKTVNSDVADNDFIYASNITGEFLPTSSGGDGELRGMTSNAYFTSLYKYSGELVTDSGELFYIENLDPISRSSTQTETIKLILNF